MLGFKRVLFVGILTALALCLTSTAVVAGGNPGRTPAPTPQDVTGDLCGPALGFVVVHAEINGEFMKTFAQPDGTTKVMVNGRFTASVTGNGKTLLFNASGPGTLILRGNTVLTIIGRGASFVISPTGVGLWIYNGRVVFDSNGNIVSHSGNVTDICALLAA